MRPSSLAPLLRRRAPTFGSLNRHQPSRRYNVHEFQSMDIMRKFGVPTAEGNVAKSPQEAEKVAKSLNAKEYVVKAQVLTGGRGKGTFEGGFVGGVQMCKSDRSVGDVASKMLGKRLVTKQSGPKGKPCNEVWVGPKLNIKREAYFAILLDPRNPLGPVMMASDKGGMNIEEVDQKFIYKENIDITVGPTEEAMERLMSKAGFAGPQLRQAVETAKRLYAVFTAKDCTMLEINPLVETQEGQVVCVDAKLNFDDAADFRQAEVFRLRDESQENPREVEARRHNLNYIGLQGNIGCLVNGAGLAMATMDIIKLHGGLPANFLDLGGGANANQVTAAFGIVNSDPQVKAILVNIFGGIMKCDTIALGMIRAVGDLGIKKPIVVRMAGTNVKEANRLIEESGLRMIAASDLDDAAIKTKKVLEVVKQAEESGKGGNGLGPDGQPVWC